MQTKSEKNLVTDINQQNMTDELPGFGYTSDTGTVSKTLTFKNESPERPVTAKRSPAVSV